MGLNYVPRPPREQLNPPNEFISATLGAEDVHWSHDMMIDTILEFEDAVLDRILERMKRVGYAAVVGEPA